MATKKKTDILEDFKNQFLEAVTESDGKNWKHFFNGILGTINAATDKPVTGFNAFLMTFMSNRKGDNLFATVDQVARALNYVRKGRFFQDKDGNPVGSPLIKGSKAIKLMRPFIKKYKKED